MGRLSAVSLPDPGDVVSLLRSTSPEASTLGAGGAAAAAAATGTAPLAVVVPVLWQALAQEKSTELLARSDRVLAEKLEELDDDRRSQQCLAKVLGGISTLLPDSSQYSSPALRTAEGEPDKLASLFQAYQDDPEYRRDVEQTISRVLAGEVTAEELGDDHDDFVDYLRDAFEVETRDEALGMFLDFRELVQAREVHETIETVHGIELDLETLQETRSTLETKLDAILAADVRSEGLCNCYRI